jgi:hypothetical protein
MKKRLLGLALGAGILQSSAGSFLAKVSWDNPNGSFADGFKIYLAIGSLPYTDPSTQVFTVTNGAATSHNIPVVPGTSYRVVVTAFNKWQESDKSADVLWSAPPLLVSPTNVQAAVIIYVP